MKIVVCVKVVPVSDSIITIVPEKTAIDLVNIKFDLNPYDEFAIEAAVLLKEKNGGEVIAISLGPERDNISLKRVLALGADRMIHLVTADKALSDPLATAKALATEIKPLSPDLIFCGKLSIDTGNGLVGPLVARLLGYPFLTGICELQVGTDRLTAAKDTEEGRIIYESSLPCLLTTEKGLNKPRYPSLKDIMLSRKKEIITKNVTLTEKASEIIQLLEPAPRPAGTILGQSVDAVPELIRRLREEAKVL